MVFRKNYDKKLFCPKGLVVFGEHDGKTSDIVGKHDDKQINIDKPQDFKGVPLHFQTPPYLADCLIFGRVAWFEVPALRPQI